jgi:DNA-binding cell septation regulator SpoVG
MAINKNSNAALEVSDQAEYMHYLKSAPIMDFAKYSGISLDEAVQRRVDAAVENAPLKMEISVRPIEPQGNLYGFASVNLGGVKVDDFKIVQNSKGELFVGMPSKPDKNSETGYRNTVFVNKDIREPFNAMIIHEYTKTVEQAQARAANSIPAPQEPPPPRIVEQVKKAQKEADKHNAALPEKGKNNKKREEIQ